MSLADCGDWPPVRILGTYSRLANCQSCHGSQVTTRLEPGIGAVTEWTTLDINCESCHGPGRGHVEAASAGGPGARDIAMASRVTDGVEQSLNVCFQCHALKDVVREGYLSGAPLEEHYALKLPVLGDDPYLPDGRVKTFAYQGTHLSSSCYVDGNMTCVSCHEPHGLGYWDVNRLPLDDEVGGAVPFARSDHTIPVPRPALDGRLGLVSACRGCHADLSEIRLQTQAEDWWGATKPQDRTTAGLLTVTAGMGSDLAARLLLHHGDAGSMDHFRGLARFLMGWVRPGDGMAADASARVLRMAASPDLDVRALALAVLPGDAGVLRSLGLLYNRTGDFEEAIGAFTESLEADPIQPLVHVNMGIARAASGNPAGAIRDYNAAIALDPYEPLAHFNTGNVHLRGGDLAAAIQSYERAVALGPELARAHLNLAIALARAGRVREALPHGRRAVEFGPGDETARQLLADLEAAATGGAPE